MLLDSAPSYVIPNNDVTPKKRGTENRVIANIRFLILFLILRLLPGRKLGRDYEIPPPNSGVFALAPPSRPGRRGCLSVSVMFRLCVKTNAKIRISRRNAKYLGLFPRQAHQKTITNYYHQVRKPFSLARVLVVTHSAGCSTGVIGLGGWLHNHRPKVI